jgi:uncharacterized protein
MRTLHITNSPKAFLDVIEKGLLRREAEYNLFLGLLTKVIKGEENVEDYFFAYVEENGQPVVGLLKTPGKNLILASLQDQPLACFSYIVKELLRQNITLPGVIGEAQLATQFVTEWENETKGTAKVEMKQFIYQLDEVNDIPISQGNMRLATEGEIDLITEWIMDFTTVTPDILTVEQARKLAQDSIRAQSLYVWEVDSKVVSMAKKNRPTKNGMVVTLVYTPKELRGNGYASSVVAHLSQVILDEGYKFCSLYTDALNPTSNHIYTEIGYRPIAESIMYSFSM